MTTRHLELTALETMRATKNKRERSSPFAIVMTRDSHRHFAYPACRVYRLQVSTSQHIEGNGSERDIDYTLLVEALGTYVTRYRRADKCAIESIRRQLVGCRSLPYLGGANTFESPFAGDLRAAPLVHNLTRLVFSSSLSPSSLV